jgi:hypothetical protein
VCFDTIFTKPAIAATTIKSRGAFNNFKSKVSLCYGILLSNHLKILHRENCVLKLCVVHQTLNLNICTSTKEVCCICIPVFLSKYHRNIGWIHTLRPVLRHQQTLFLLGFSLTVLVLRLDYHFVQFLIVVIVNLKINAVALGVRILVFRFYSLNRNCNNVLSIWILVMRHFRQLLLFSTFQSVAPNKSFSVAVITLFARLMFAL